MELDEFKVYWQKIQEQENQQQKHTPETLEQLIMKTTTTLSEIQRKNIFWNTAAKAVCPALIAVLIIELGITYFLPEALTGHNFLQSTPWVIVMVIFALVTMWVSNKNEQIFNIDISKNLKETLTKAITDFKRFQIISNAIYLFLFPAYYCAMIKLFVVQFYKLTTPAIVWICVALTILSFIGNLWYYMAKFHKRFKSLEANLKELGE
ncbi:hypothetical protein SAMN05216490_1193 [Mucilaginibacter mallensis]|uniref:Uncharacterized protein n=1 Tax=Mucilaginibacter mallensis TaxID=652787 RepID=A0A1H1SDV6_MUCMA|nr:hypothetical protein [Mucilaginibacter mallensis]SDS45978.1 hypothetical protein SAMN05216490_1193 [Mucilaginibacter mallensis]